MMQLDDDKDRWLRRQALALVSQLPDCPREAAAVLSYAGDLVGSFLTPRELPSGTAGGARVYSIRKDVRYHGLGATLVKVALVGGLGIFHLTHFV